ncbi:winged helix-turn-helix transcriptional regulator [Bradyrhizobium sp. USDA 4486]
MKGKRTSLDRANCGIARSLEIVGDWWSLLIIRNAFQGASRFGEFQKSLGLAKNILSSRLKKLVEADIFRVEPDDVSPSINRYLLTDKGEKLYVVLIALWQWGEENCFKPGELKHVIVDTRNRKPLERLQIRAKDGRSVGPRDFRTIRTEPERHKAR